MTEDQRSADEYADEAKYVVLKQSDIPRIRPGLWAMVLEDIEPLDDAVVIRLKDSYAASALHAYTNAILTVLDIMGDDMDPEKQQQQLDIADYFHQQAVASGEIKNKRMPD